MIMDIEIIELNDENGNTWVTVDGVDAHSVAKYAAIVDAISTAVEAM